MATLTVSIESTDDAFVTDPCGEGARLLRLIAERVAAGHEGGQLWDSNGNRCGSWDFDAPEPDDDNEED